MGLKRLMLVRKDHRTDSRESLERAYQKHGQAGCCRIDNLGFEGYLACSEEGADSAAGAGSVNSVVESAMDYVDWVLGVLEKSLAVSCEQQEP